MVKELFPAVQSRVQPSQSAQPGGRPDLIRAVFEAADRNRNGVLDAQEMRNFAQIMGFDGGEAEWAEEFATLCSWHGEVGRDSIDLPLFTVLVNDSSDNGCYCTDEELGAIRRKLGLQTARPPPGL